MTTQKRTGGNEKAESGKNLPFLPPNSAHLGHLTPDEIRIVVAIVEKTPGESWEKVSQTLGVSRRSPFDLRQNRRIQEAVYMVSRELLRFDVGSVLAALSQKARSGDIAAMRLFFELLERYDTKERRAYLGEDPFADLRRKLGEGLLED